MAYCNDRGCGWGGGGVSGCNTNCGSGGNNGCSNVCNNGRVSGAYDRGCGSSGCNSGFSCVINLIIILIVLQFLTQIICE